MQKRVLAAFVFCLAALIIALLVLTAGVKADFLENVVIARLWISSSSDGLFDDPAADGYYDWYSIHFLSICFGYNTTDAYGNTDGITTSGCDTSNAPGTHQFNIGRAFVPWCIGAGFAGIAFLAFPFFFRGTFHHNGWLMLSLFLSFLFLMVGAIFGLVATSDDYKDTSARLFVQLTWIAVGCMFIAWNIEFVEHALQRFTPRGQPISRKYKPANVPWVSYNMRGLVNAANQEVGMIQTNLGNTMNMTR